MDSFTGREAGSWGSGEAGEREGGRSRGRVLRSRPGGVWSAKIWTLIIYHFCSKPISMKFIMSVQFDPKRRTNSAKETRNKWKKPGFLSPKYEP